MAGGDPRAVTVGARKLVDILRALPEDTEVTLQQQDKRLLVKAGKSRFTLQTLPAEDFPRLAKLAGEAARFVLSQKALRRLLGLVQYAMAQQDIRYYLNGLLMVVEIGRATSELQSRLHLVCRLLLEKKKKQTIDTTVHSTHTVEYYTGQQST